MRCLVAVVLLCLSLSARAEDAAPAKIDLNNATTAELQTLPGIGPSKADKIVAYRKRRPFRTVEELVRVKGFGRKTVLRLRPMLAANPPGAAQTGPVGRTHPQTHAGGGNGPGRKRPAHSKAQPSSSATPGCDCTCVES